MKIDIISLFPEYFKSPFEQSLLKRAIKKNLISINCIDLRNFGLGTHSQVDDRTYGGGVGMVLKPEPIFNAIESLKQPDTQCVYLSPQGSVLTAEKSRELASYSHVIFLCGHYEGIDDRVIETCVDEEISIGDYVLTSGSAAALVVIDALSRFIPGVIGNDAASEQDSFENNLLDFSHYTRPEVFRGNRVPEVLLEGNHEVINEWRKSSRLKNTVTKRPDLYFQYLMSEKKFREDNRIVSQHACTIQVTYLLKARRIEETLAFYDYVFSDLLHVIEKEEFSACVSLFEGQLKILFKVVEDEILGESKMLSVTLDDEDVFLRICRQWKKKKNVSLQKGNNKYWIFFGKDPSENGWTFILNKKEENL